MSSGRVMSRRRRVAMALQRLAPWPSHFAVPDSPQGRVGSSPSSSSQVGTLTCCATAEARRNCIFPRPTRMWTGCGGAALDEALAVELVRWRSRSDIYKHK